MIVATVTFSISASGHSHSTRWPGPKEQVPQASPVAVLEVIDADDVIVDGFEDVVVDSMVLDEDEDAFVDASGVLDEEELPRGSSSALAKGRRHSSHERCMSI